MSTDAATADMWVADLEDILGLSPMGRQEPGADREGLTNPARSRSIYIAVVVLGFAMLVVGVAHTNFSSSMGDRSPDRGQFTRTQPRLARLDPPGLTAGIDTAVDRLIETDANPPMLGSKTIASGWQKVRPTSHSGREQTSPAGNVNAGGRAVVSLTAGAVGREIAAAPDPAGPELDASRSTALPEVGLAGDDARFVNARPVPLPPSGTTDGVLGQPVSMSSDEAGTTLAPVRGEKTSLKKTGAIDALRMLRRQ